MNCSPKDNILAHKASLNRCKKIKITSRNAVSLNTKRKKNPRKYKHMETEQYTAE
jgi:hypothetical protein